MIDKPAPKPSDQTSAPPKHLRRQVRHLQHPDEAELLPSESDLLFTENDGRSLRLRGPSGVERTVESLPVLRAFQEFLDGERRRTRSRILFLTAFFAAVLITVVSAGLYVGMIFMDQLRGDVDDLSSQVQDARQTADRSRKEDASALMQVRSETAAMRDTLQHDRAALADAAEQMHSGLADYTNNLSGLAEMVAMLKVESAGIKEELADLRAVWRAPQPADTSSDSRILTMSITPRGSEQSYAWRVPLPEQ